MRLGSVHIGGKTLCPHQAFLYFTNRTKKTMWGPERAHSLSCCFCTNEKRGNEMIRDDYSFESQDSNLLPHEIQMS